MGDPILSAPREPGEVIAQVSEFGFLASQLPFFFNDFSFKEEKEDEDEDEEDDNDRGLPILMKGMYSISDIRVGIGPTLTKFCWLSDLIRDKRLVFKDHPVPYQLALDARSAPEMRTLPDISQDLDHPQQASALSTLAASSFRLQQYAFFLHQALLGEGFDVPPFCPNFQELVTKEITAGKKKK